MLCPAGAQHIFRAWGRTPLGLTTKAGEIGRRGRVIYVRFCWWSHGTEEDCDGSGAFSDVMPDLRRSSRTLAS